MRLHEKEWAWYEMKVYFVMIAQIRVINICPFWCHMHCANLRIYWVYIQNKTLIGRNRDWLNKVFQLPIQR